MGAEVILTPGFDIAAPSANLISRKYQLTQYPEALLLCMLEKTAE